MKQSWQQYPYITEGGGRGEGGLGIDAVIENELGATHLYISYVRYMSWRIEAKWRIYTWLNKAIIFVDISLPLNRQ